MVSIPGSLFTHPASLDTIAVLCSLLVRPSRRNLGELLAIFWSLCALKSGYKPSRLYTTIEENSDVRLRVHLRAGPGLKNITNFIRTGRFLPSRNQAQHNIGIPGIQIRVAPVCAATYVVREELHTLRYRKIPKLFFNKWNISNRVIN
jgi:hypothetical protein